MSLELRRATSTIMFVDVVESVRLLEADESGTVERVFTLLSSMSADIIPRFGGKALETRGDGLLIQFERAPDAARCAFALHDAAARESNSRPVEQKIILRAGINTAEVFSKDLRVFGAGVSLAARIAALGEAGDTIASGSTRDQLVAGLDCELEDIGDCFLKHVSEPVRAFRLRELDSPATGPLAPDSGLPAREVIPRPNPQSLKPFLAVLPFTSSEADVKTRAMGDLLAQSVIHASSRGTNVNVIAWLSSKPFADRDLSATEIGRALKADWLLTGSVYLNGDRLLVQAELIRVATNTTELAERIVDDVADLLQEKSEIAGRLASAVINHLTKVEASRVARHPLPTIESHALLVGAIGLMHRSGPADFLRSKDAFEHLMERHPRNHAPRPWLAKWYVMRSTRGLSADREGSAARAIEQTSRALDAQPGDAFSLAVQGFVHFHLKRDVETAVIQLESAVRLDPNDALASIFSSAALSAKGLQDQAWLRAERAMTLSPFDPLRAYMRMIAASCALSAEHYTQAARLLNESIRESASHAASWRTLIIALVGAGQIDEAREACRKLLLLEPDLTIKSYKARISLPTEQARRAIEALTLAGIPLG